MKKAVLLVLTDRWADWEAAYALYGINFTDNLEVKTIAVDDTPKASLGGLRTEIDYTIKNYHDLANTAMLILPGGLAWQEDNHDEVADFVRRATAQGIPIAAICGATIFLGKHGFLDDIKHTGDDLHFFTGNAGYGGQDNYVAAQVIVDGGFITANETAAVDFAYEIYKTLKIDDEASINAWYERFKKV